MHGHALPAGLHRRAACALLLALSWTGASACSSEEPPEAPDAAIPVDATATPGDGRPPLLEVAHVPADGAFAGAGRLILRDGAIIDTEALTVDGELLAGEVVFDAWPQEPAGPELAVLHVNDFGIENGTVTVRGSRPLVIIAGNEIRLAGLLDAGARGVEPGPGGFGPGQGAGAGGQGKHAGNAQDGGGGGGGHGSTGAMGGSGVCVGEVCADGGAGGGVSGTDDLDVLAGGAGGGAGSVVEETETCIPAPGGGGGGAVQLTAVRIIRIEAGGGVHAGGGGGAGGTLRDLCDDDNGGGGGGGAGGAIYVQAPEVEHRGVLAANGGGGGSGASDDRFPGQDATPDDQPAPGGQQVNSVAFAGGCGFALASTSCAHEGGGGDGNGGGGGGGVGRIVIVTERYEVDSGLASPAVTLVTN